MEKRKVLLIIEALNLEDEAFYKDWLENGFSVSTIFKKVSKPIRAIRRICLTKNIGDVSIWLGEWFNNLEKYDSIIIHMSRLTRYLPEIISSKYPHIKVIGWYWNTIDKESEPIKNNNPNIDYYSFDKNDCKKYGIKYNAQYYCPVKLIENKKINDIYFIGRSKGREEQINKLRNDAERMGLKCNFTVIKDNSRNVSLYSDVKKELAKSKAVLEINKKNQVGFTLRTLESLFFEIKLITDNKEIKNTPIYNKNNIFILGEDNIDDLYNFINSDYDYSVNKYKDNYCIDTWFNNFYK